MNFKRTAHQSSDDILQGWDGICREFGCSEQQLQELYRQDEQESTEAEFEFSIISETEFAERAIFSSGEPLN
jgi:hypothetical protein